MAFSCVGSPYHHGLWAANSIWIHRTPNVRVKHGLDLLFSLPVIIYLSFQLTVTEPGRIREHPEAFNTP